MWTQGALLRLAHADACRELAELARSQVTTTADSYRGPGELVEDAQRLLFRAREVLELAVAAERERGVSWEQIGELLGAGGQGISRQAATKRFGERVDELELELLLPDRAPAHPGGLSWWAGPECVSDPDAAVARLDAWAARHRERTDPGRDRDPDRLVSAGLHATPVQAGTSAIAATTKLAGLLADPDRLPAGVSEARARRRFLEFKQAAMHSVAAGVRGADRYTALESAEAAARELEQLWTQTARDRLALSWAGPGTATVELSGRPWLILQANRDTRDPAGPGWWLWKVGPDGHADDDGGTWPQLVEVDLDAEHEHVEHVCLEHVARDLGRDRAKHADPWTSPATPPEAPVLAKTAAIEREP